MIVEVKRQAEKDLRKLENPVRLKIRARIDDLASIPPPPRDQKRLSGNVGWFRIRVGDYRVAYKVEPMSVVVGLIGHRRDFYDRLQRVS